jgi:succinate-acetate transporter protein
VTRTFDQSYPKQNANPSRDAVDNGAYFGFGAILMILGGFFELILGNTFPAVVFTSFGGFWFTYGSFLVPSFGACKSFPRPCSCAMLITS